MAKMARVEDAYGGLVEAFNGGGPFTAWVGSSHAKVISAAGWRIQDNSGKREIIEGFGASKGASYANRGALRGIQRVLNTLPTGAHVDLHVTQKYIVDGLNGQYVDWKLRGWKTKTGDLAHHEIWKEIVSNLEKRQIILQAHHAGIRSSERLSCESLKGRAHVLAEARLAEITGCDDEEELLLHDDETFDREGFENALAKNP